MTVLDMTNPRNRRFFHMRQCIGALRIEVNTGMSHSRGSVLRMVQREYDIRATTKKGALKELELKFNQEFPEVAGTPTT